MKRIIQLIITLLCWPLLSMAVPAYVTSSYATANNGGSGNPNVQIGANITTNDLIVAHCFWASISITLSSVTDTAGNSYTIVGTVVGDSSGPERAQAAWAIVSAGSGTRPTITCTLSNSSVTGGIQVADYNGTATSSPFDVSTTNLCTTSCTTTLTTGSATTTVNGDLIVGLFTTDNGNPQTWTQGSGYTLRSPASQQPPALEDQVQSTAGSIAATATDTTVNSWTAILLSFKPLPAAGGGAVKKKKIIFY